MNEPLVHGLADELVAADWPPPTAAELTAALEEFGLEPVEGESWISPRPLSSAMLVPVTGGSVLVKRHDLRVRTAAQLAEEHGFADHLRARGIPTPGLLRTQSGASALEQGGWSYEVQQPAAGVDRYRDAMSWTPFTGIADARSAGELLARLHLAAADYDAPPRTTTALTSRVEVITAGTLVGVIDRLRRTLPQPDAVLVPPDRALDAYLTATLQDASARLRQLQPAWVHNDWHASNLFWDPAGGSAVTSVIDFGLADVSYPVVDLAIALERNALRWLELPDPDIAMTRQAAELLAGYQTVRPLTPPERELLPLLLPVCHLDFALSEVDYFGRLLADPARALVAWRDYALAHTAWFTGSAGQEFLARLRTALAETD